MIGLHRGSLALVVTLGFGAAELHAEHAASAKPPTQPLFSRHIVPVFSRLGCNSGACKNPVTVAEDQDPRTVVMDCSGSRTIRFSPRPS